MQSSSIHLPLQNIAAGNAYFTATTVTNYQNEAFLHNHRCNIMLDLRLSARSKTINRFIAQRASGRSDRHRICSIRWGISYLQFIWYKDHERVPFHFYNDSKGYLQIDKWGHGFSAYQESALGYYALRSAGVSKRRALIYGGTAGIIMQAPIEVFDGLYEGWGFSCTDIIANTAGSLLFISQEALFDDQLVLMKFSYSPSEYPQYHPKLGTTPVQSFFYDYNAHTYWLSANISSITGLTSIPRWINVAFGYSANGMIGEFENPEYYHGKPFPHLERYRQYLISLDVDFSSIRTDKKWLKTLFSAVNLIKVPFPAVEINRVEGLRFRPLYF